MIKIYMADTALLPDEEAVLENMVFLDEERKRKVWRCGNLEDKKRSLLAGYLIQAGAKEWMAQEGGLQGDAKPLFLSYRYSEYGKPYISRREDMHFNISHSKNYVVCAFSDKEVGIDIQVHRNGKGDVAQRFFSAEDRELMRSLAQNGENPEEIFFSIWTVKEAYMKLTGEGMRQGLDTTAIEFDEYSRGETQEMGHSSICKQGRISKREEKNRNAYFRVYREYDKMSRYSMAVCSYGPMGDIQRQEVRDIKSI